MNKMNIRTQIQLTRRIALLLESGISLTEVLSIMINMERSSISKKDLREIKDRVDRGQTLSQSILSTIKNFNSSLITLMEQGESIGTLIVTLYQGATNIEKNLEIRTRIIHSLIYPAIIFIVTICMALFLILYIFPKILPLFVSMNISLPILTRIILGLYKVMLHYGIQFTLCITFLSSILLLLYKKKLTVRYHIQTQLLRLPIVGEILMKYLLATQCRSMSLLLEHGQTLSELLLQNITFEPYSRSLRSIREKIRGGVSLYNCLQAQPNLYPSLMTDLIHIGERTGSLSQITKHIAQIFETDIENFTKQLSIVIEPVLMIFMGLLVGSIALSIILPIYEVTNHLIH